MNFKDRFNLDLPSARMALEEELISLKGNTDRKQLDGIDSDTAFELGYESAISDLRRVTGDNPFEVHLIALPLPQAETRNENDHGTDTN